ncbi:Auxin transport protein BIG [Raphanus sativus]|nr:Auxin transport protein BIG [Raphanus sativus]
MCNDCGYSKYGRRCQQLLGFKKPLLKIVSSIGETEMDSQHKDTVQQMMASLPRPSCKINCKVTLFGCTGLRRALMSYLHHINSNFSSGASRYVVSKTPNNCYGCATTFFTQCLEILQMLSKHPRSRKQLVAAGILSELFGNNVYQGSELNNLVQKKIMYCLEHHRSMDIALATREEMLVLSEIISVACTPPKSDTSEKEIVIGKTAPTVQEKDEKAPGVLKCSSETEDNNSDISQKTLDTQLVSYLEWEKGASYLDFVRWQYKASQARTHRSDFLALKFALRWKRRTSRRHLKVVLQAFDLGSWVTELILSACYQSIWSEFILEQLCNLICPSKPEAVYMLIPNRAHTQEEFIRGSMTKSPYSSAEIGPLMRDV